MPKTLNAIVQDLNYLLPKYGELPVQVHIQVGEDCQYLDVLDICPISSATMGPAAAISIRTETEFTKTPQVKSNFIKFLEYIETSPEEFGSAGDAYLAIFKKARALRTNLNT